MAILTNALQSLIDVGNDAQSNLYRVNFSGGMLGQSPSFRTTQNGENILEALTIRCSGFEPPAITQENYQVKYITAYIDRPSTKITINRNFTLKFRADDYWGVYKTLCNQQRITMNSQLSYVNLDMSSTQLNKMFNVSVDFINKLSTDGNPDDVTRLYNFKHCWIESITPDTFTTDGSQPLMVECSINFIKMEDWQSGLTNGGEYQSSMLSPLALDTTV